MDIHPGIRRSGYALECRVPQGPCSRSQANLAPDTLTEENPSERQVEKSELEENLAKSSDSISEETNNRFAEEMSLFRKQQKLLKFQFHSKLEERSARVVFFEKSFTDPFRGLDP